MAHELGHRNLWDSRITLAVVRLDGWFRYSLVGLGLKLLGNLWIGWLNRSEYAADAYAQALGVDMIGALEAMVLQGEDVALDDMVRLGPWMRFAAHPSAMQRISRLREREGKV